MNNEKTIQFLISYASSEVLVISLKNVFVPCKYVSRFALLLCTLIYNQQKYQTMLASHIHLSLCQWYC